MTEIILSSQDMSNILEELARQLIRDFPDGKKLIFVGIQRRGADIARQLCAIIYNLTQIRIPCGSIDINLYRDDWTRITDRNPHIGKTSMPENLDDKIIILVDDVLFSGRTIRAAMEALFDYGRPNEIRVLVLIDRGHRELPICANYTGKTISTLHGWRIDVLTTEHDGENAVLLKR